LRVIYGEPTADGYLIHVNDDAAIRPYDREKNTIVSTNGPSDILTLTGVTGSEDKPTALNMEFNKGDHEAITITPDRAYERVDGYTATMIYPPDSNVQLGEDRRIGDRFRLEGADYIIIAITENTVVVSSRDNNKRTTIPFSPSTASP
jgi:hypothetical protein